METKSALKKLLQTNAADTTAFIIRVVTAVVIFPHGAQKLLGWFGGYGYSGTMGYFTDSLNIPYILGLLVILLESVGALLLIAGLGTRIVSSGLLIVMLSAFLMVHINNGFFMNWFGNQNGEGAEYFILIITLLALSVIKGGGKFSVDNALAKRS